MYILSWRLVLVTVPLTRHHHNQLRGDRTGPSRSGAEEYPREKIEKHKKWYTYHAIISYLGYFIPEQQGLDHRAAGFVPLSVSPRPVVHLGGAYQGQRQSQDLACLAVRESLRVVQGHESRKSIHVSVCSLNIVNAIERLVNSSRQPLQFQEQQFSLYGVS